ncbi:hypothetical protein [Collimonas fungivorans]|uniref:Putative outer membrane adhesin like protein n=1 Tax=Collimonas fungivorans (strain Ter331) TaxID=1005048 RepID=G0AH92_COLFT|nr:hypothetical protein [Collimonas fungivorans]AEK62498.1 putative outer membrane adhesin like protein [Collimonas fungivorans Ter331]
MNEQQILIGKDFNIQTSEVTRASGEKDIYLTSADGLALNNGQDKLVEAGYDASGKQIVELNEQTNGSSIEMNINGNGTTTMLEYANNPDGTINWGAAIASQILQGTSTDVQASEAAVAGGGKDIFLTTNDGLALNNGQDKMVEAGYNASGKQIVELNEQTNGSSIEMNINGNGTTTMLEYANNPDGTINWGAAIASQILQGTSTDVQASEAAVAGGGKDIFLTTNDGLALNNGQDKMVEAGYDASGKQIVELNEQTNGSSIEMNINGNGTTTMLEYANNPDGTINWGAAIASQILQGTSTDVQASEAAVAGGGKDIFLTTNDGLALNNGQDKMVEAGYDASGKQIVELNEQTNGSSIEMNINGNGTTTMLEYANNPDGTINWGAAIASQILQGTSTDVQASEAAVAGGGKDIYLTSNDGLALNNGLDKLLEAGYNTAGKQTLEFNEQVDGRNVLMNFNANNTTTVSEFGNNTDGTVNWSTVLASANYQGIDMDVGATDSGSFTDEDPTEPPLTVYNPEPPPPPIEPPPPPGEPSPPPGEPSPPPDEPSPPPDEPSPPPEDPIILNLKGKAVDTVGLSNSPAHFDMQNNGQKVQTGWAAAGEGMLVYDPNNTGTVTNDTSLVAGFGALSTLANQTGGELDASNPLWNSLKVWVDPNGDANFQQGELYSLNQLGISSINLNTAAEQLNNNGNTILNESTFTWVDGTIGHLAGVNLAYQALASLNPSPTARVNALLRPATASPDPEVMRSLHNLTQSMAAFTDGSAGIDTHFSLVHVNAEIPHLTASDRR